MSLDRDLPFSFVDDKIFHGNSLLGLTDLGQLRALHIDPPRNQQPRLSARDMDTVVRRAVQIRRDLATEVAEHDPQRSTNAKHRQLARLHDLTRQLTMAADGVIAAGLRLGGKPGKALDAAYEDLAEAIVAAIPSNDATTDTAFIESILADGLTPTVLTDYDRWRPLHWVLEVPDVLLDHHGFDAVIGNPPFLGGKKLTGTMGTNIRDWLVYQLADDARGNADLVAYFLLRAVSLLRPTGTLGLIATNTVAQGDTREVGLDQVVTGGFTLTRAVQSAPWPSASANLEYAAVWGSRGSVAEVAHRVADGVVVPKISTLLEPAGRVDGSPARLNENEGISFQGCVVLGMGFVLEPDEALTWIDEDERNRDVLFPYLNGEDLNSRPDNSPSRWVIDFNDRPIDESQRYVSIFERVQRLVLPKRLKVNRKALRDRWWQYADKRPALRKAIAQLDEVLVIALVSKSVMPVRVPTGQVFSHKLGVFATDSFADQAALSSTLHQLWAIKYGSTMRADVNYSPSDVFLTFPRPSSTSRLADACSTLDHERREIMLRRDLGLTKMYNLVNDPQHADTDDPDIARMRQLHVELDRAVMTAYGWSDVPLDHGFHTYRQMERWTVSPAARVEILDRLLAENLRRASAQHEAAAKTTKGRARKTVEIDEAQGTLL